MKVYLAAIAGIVPSQIVQALNAFVEFCYIARRNAITEDSLVELNTSFHQACTIFETVSVPPPALDDPLSTSHS
jgi:hypothetical protein